MQRRQPNLDTSNIQLCHLKITGGFYDNFANLVLFTYLVSISCIVGGVWALCLSTTMLRKMYSYLDEWKSMWEPDLEAIAYNGATCDPTRVDPKVLQWTKQNCSHQPHFIKIVNIGAAHNGSNICQLVSKLCHLFHTSQHSNRTRACWI